MKKCTRLLALLLTVVMLLSMLPTMVLAAETGTEPLEYGIVHLDCGRKYFSVDSIKAIIDATETAGMNYVQLAFGNDGMRFLLNDMSLTVNGVNYSSDAVKAAVHQGNQNYNNRKGYTPSVNELTESEMNEIIAYAKTKGVGIIPLLNTPGHMDAILDAGEALTGQTLSYNSSKTTIDLSNDTAKAFTKAVVQKYVHYFAAKGCTAFNMGSDEYANDRFTGGGMGFEKLVITGEYNKFIDYVNALVDMIKAAGMTPMAFNDGIYFQNNKSCGSISTDLVVQYWSQGWGSESWGSVSGYYLRHAKDLESDGFKLINAKGDFYYIVGKNDFYHYNAAEGYQHTYKSADRASEFKLKEFYGSNVNQPVGAAYLIWCDFPAVETEGEIVSHNEEIIPVFGGTLPQCAPAKWSDETGTDPETPEPEAVTVIHEPTGISATAVGLVSIDVAVHDAVTDEESVRISYDITLNDGAYTGAANVRIPKGTDFQNCVSFSGNVDGEPISVTDEGSVLVCQVPRFSQVEIIGQLAAEGGPDVTDAVIVDLTVGQTSETFRDDSGYYAEFTNSDSSVASVGLDGDPGQTETFRYTKVNNVKCGTLISSNSSSWVRAGDYYYTPDNGGNYYPLYAKRSANWTRYDYTWGYSADNASSRTQISTQTYVRSSTNAAITVYTRSGVPGRPAYTTLSFTGLLPGTTYVTVGDTTYQIVVRGVEETAAVTLSPDQTSQLVTAGDGETVTYAITQGDNIVSVDENSGIVTANALGDATVVATVKKGSAAIGTYTYTIHVIEEDLSQVEPLAIEYWITNKKLSLNGSNFVTVSAEAALNPNGIALSAVVPAEGQATEGQATEGKQYVFWKSTYHDASNKQEDNGQDMTKAGTDIKYIRYGDSSWQYSVDGNTWVNIGSDDQIVAYYLEKTDVTQEITTNVVDWGEKYSEWLTNRNGASWFWGGYVETGSKFVFMDFAVVYEDGTQNPSSFPVDNTWFYHFDVPSGGTRVMNPIMFLENETFDIWKVTVQEGTSSGYSSARTFTPVYSGEETVLWEEGVNEGTPVIEDLTYTANRSGKLLRVYVRLKNTADSAHVYYWNRDTGECFHDYPIDIESGAAFKDTIRMGVDDLVDNDIAGTFAIHRVSANIHDLPTIPLKYQTSSYQVVDVERSDDGKTLNIYYSFQNSASFVLDFGIPIYISSDEVGAGNLSDTTVTAHDGTYGKAVFKNAERELYYIPEKVLMGPDTISIDFKKGTDTSNYLLNIYPATTVFYEATEAFVKFDENWEQTAQSSASATQATVKAGTSTTNNYGYDAAYASAATSAYTTHTSNAEASFSFKGTGVDVYAAGSAQSGKVMLVLKAGGTLKKLMMIDTATAGDCGPGKASLNTPIATLRGLDYGEYSVTLVYFAAEDRTEGFTFSGFRVYDTMWADQKAVEYYTMHLEENPVYFELRDSVLTVNTPPEGYAQNIASQIYSALPTDSAGSSVVFDSGVTGDISVGMLNDGPKNELYLMPGQSVVFKVNTPRVAQIGLRSVTGDAVSYTINNDSKTISTSVDMFYDLQDKGATNENTYTITNTDDSGILSISTIKICDDPNGGLAPLTEEDLTKALLGMGYAAPFTPESFKMNWSLNTTTTAVTSILTITTSKDVKSLSVDGKQLRCSNVRGSKVWLYSVKEKTAGVYTYDVVAVNAEGAEYAVQSPELTVRESVIRSLFSRR